MRSCNFLDRDFGSITRKDKRLRIKMSKLIIQVPEKNFKVFTFARILGPLYMEGGLPFSGITLLPEMMCMSQNFTRIVDFMKLFCSYQAGFLPRGGGGGGRGAPPPEAVCPFFHTLLTYLVKNLVFNATIFE